MHTCSCEELWLIPVLHVPVATHTDSPSKAPTIAPSRRPTQMPTAKPTTQAPTTRPTSSPTPAYYVAKGTGVRCVQAGLLVNDSVWTSYPTINVQRRRLAEEEKGEQQGEEEHRQLTPGVPDAEMCYIYCSNYFSDGVQTYYNLKTLANKNECYCWWVALVEMRGIAWLCGTRFLCRLLTLTSIPLLGPTTTTTAAARAIQVRM